MSARVTETLLPLGAFLEAEKARAETCLEAILPAAEEYPATIHRAMRYAVFAGGKRLRPILCLEAGRLFGSAEEPVRRLGAALELIHTYSLIHDDLPALDNDDLRRGQPTCHRVFGEAIALLAGDALLMLAYEVLSGPGPPREEIRLRVIRELSHAIGTRAGMVGGQVVDLESTGENVKAETLDYIHASKTGAFLRMAVRGGALYAGADSPDLDRLTAFGEKIGLAFQIADDLLDVVGTRALTGKRVGKDQSRHKATYPALYGVAQSRETARRLAREAADELEPYGERARRLEEIARFIIERSG